jgi:LysR family transcriptional regulator, nitrogen assimilation regulatory protein
MLEGYSSKEYLGGQMDFRRLRYFVNVIDARSFSRAAETLNVAQPALSKSIQALELDLDAALVRRSHQGVEMTEAGERLYEHAQVLFRQIDRARLDIRNAVDKPSGHVAVGMPFSVIAPLALTVLKEVDRRFPDIHLELVQEQSHLLATRLRAGRMDLAVMASPRSPAALVAKPLVSEELFHVARPGGEGPISFVEAAQDRYVLAPIGNGLRFAVESYFRARSLALNVVHEVDSVAFIPTCVAAGLGASFLPGGCLLDHAASGRLAVRPFEVPCRRTLVLAHPLDRAISPAAASVAGIIDTVARTLAADGAWYGASSIDDLGERRG